MKTWSEGAVYSEFLRPFFQELNHRTIRYAVVRNHEGLPNSIPGTDIDILIKPSAVREVDGLIRRVSDSTGWNLLRVTNKDFRIRNYILSNLSADNEAEFIVLDIMTAVGWNGYSAWPAEEILDSPGVGEEVKNLSDAAEAAVTTVTSLTYAGGFKKSQYHELAKSAANQTETSFSALMTSAVGAETASAVSDLLSSGTPAAIDTSATLLRSGLKKTASKRLIRNFRDSLWSIKFKLGRLVSPPGILIAVIGTDGSGKSTLIEQLADRLRPVFGSTDTAHLRPRFLPDLSRVSGTRSEETTNQNTAHTRSPGILGSLIRWGYYWFDYLVGYQIVFRPKMARKSAIIIDRYFYDFEFDYGQKNVKLPGWLVRIMQKALPKPDVVVHIDTDTLIVLDRRGNEVDESEINRQRIALREIVGRLDNAGTIDGSLSLDEVADHAVSLIVKKLTEGR